jgi:hypothetical protein
MDDTTGNEEEKTEHLYSIMIRYTVDSNCYPDEYEITEQAYDEIYDELEKENKNFLCFYTTTGEAIMIRCSAISRIVMEEIDNGQ